jgi:hypothetical protein
MRSPVHRKLPTRAILIAAGLILPQLAAPTEGVSQTYLGTPATPGTRTPEQSPATEVQAPPTPAPRAATPSTAGTAESTGPTTPSSGISFGAAPPPITSPGR